MRAYEIDPYKRTAKFIEVESWSDWGDKQGFKHTDFVTVWLNGKYFAVLFSPAEAYAANALASVYERLDGEPVIIALCGAVLVMGLTQPNNADGELIDLTDADILMLLAATEKTVTVADPKGHACLYVQEVIK